MGFIRDSQILLGAESSSRKKDTVSLIFAYLIYEGEVLELLI